MLESQGNKGTMTGYQAYSFALHVLRNFYFHSHPPIPVCHVLLEGALPFHTVSWLYVSNGKRSGDSDQYSTVWPQTAWNPFLCCSFNFQLQINLRSICSVKIKLFFFFFLTLSACWRFRGFRVSPLSSPFLQFQISRKQMWVSEGIRVWPVSWDPLVWDRQAPISGPPSPTLSLQGRSWKRGYRVLRPQRWAVLGSYCA